MKNSSTYLAYGLVLAIAGGVIFACMQKETRPAEEVLVFEKVNEADAAQIRDSLAAFGDVKSFNVSGTTLTVVWQSYTNANRESPQVLHTSLFVSRNPTT